MSDMRDTEPLLLDENRMRHVIEWAYEHSKERMSRSSWKFVVAIR
jgi:hypothetical protein